MKILFLLSSLNAGGAERVACTLVNAWVAKGYEVVMVPCFSQGSGQSFYSLDARVQVRWLSEALPSNKWLARLVKPIVLRRIMQEVKADVMVSFLTNVNVMALLAKQGLDIPLIVCERSDPSFQKISASLRFLRRHLYAGADAVLLQTEQAAKMFAQSMPVLRRLRVIPNPLPIDLEKSLENEGNNVGTQSGSKVAVAVGRLVPSKQFDKLIANFTHIAAQCPDWQLHIYGDGPERETLQQLITSSHMQERIYLKGKTNQPWAVMRQAQLLAMSSRLEGFPNVMLEAMACGLPVICYDCPSGPRELSINGEVARLVALDDEKAYQQQLLELMQNSEERMLLAKNGQQSVLTRYSQWQVLKLWDDLLAEVAR
ncbi:glycosyltransferase family 4 protein [Pelistega europaea]|uniref:Glycosyltransferase family 4 protein n=1 Tax=Pelistega europaea TaxID=106147 RepID=A0A7Y4P657_9BURK|nr:glycosyltransferase family 4 protein [Pelistega europaea]NOL50458.1 glycosyltransferase family 4 protein [Pelistega europaea]